jgi:cysteine-rich repeat protein
MTLRFLIPALLTMSCLGVACGEDKVEPSDAREDGGLEQTDEDVEGVVSLVDGGVDAGLIVLTCEGAADGTSCGSMGGLICLNDECVTSACGDGFMNPLMQEECDDGNDLLGDGCELDCKPTCSEIGECDDGNACNGNEVCDTADHVCVAGTTAVDETPCTSAAVADGECRTGICVPEGCGDLATEGVEECDDGNQVSGDGCEPTCTFSCNEDADCSDNDVCNGVETCDAEQHLCVLGAAPACDAKDECHEGTCDPLRGCQETLIDADGDRFAPIMGSCGDDCDDTRGDINPGQVELCDDVDQDCDGEEQPDEAPTWYVDCDADGYADLRAKSLKQCEMPAPTSCGGRWTTMAPSNDQNPPTHDCFDGDPAVNPSQSGWFSKPANESYDYNCDLDETRRWVNGKIGVDATCLSFGGVGCTGPSGWVGSIAACGARGSYTMCQGGAVEIEAAAAAAGTIINPPGEPCGLRGCTCSRVTVERIQECH